MELLLAAVPALELEHLGFESELQLGFLFAAGLQLEILVLVAADLL